MDRKFLSWIFVLGYLHASSGQTTTSETLGTFEPFVFNMTATPLNTTPPTTTTEAVLDSLAHLQAKLTSYGEVSNATIIKLVKQFFRDNLLNGTAHAVTVTEIQRIVDSTTAATTIIPTTRPTMHINTTTTPITPLTPTPLNTTTPMTPTTMNTTTPMTSIPLNQTAPLTPTTMNTTPMNPTIKNTTTPMTAIPLNATAPMTPTPLNTTTPLTPPAT
ncbi:platelet glycoprotein Ib alpha chain [Dicentrarchus labrax]|uniref:platelet glycoprotein Ib alpha chain n=1 Tax=Dicentrarchus labrax TaxID=13489 RepID=UPI0021F5293F|nr:platelet glycoprotein Ib alpha chain [Dicentrarchus labrax]